MKTGRPRTPVELRLWGRVTVGAPDDCWEWRGHRNHRGYGQIKRAGRHGGMTSTHRIAWELTNGAVPAGLFVCHRCDNPPCCNPGHLFLGSNSDNQRDSVQKGRHFGARKTHCRNGHELSDANTYRRPDGGGRGCRKCRTAQVYACKARKSA